MKSNKWTRSANGQKIKNVQVRSSSLQKGARVAGAVQASPTDRKRQKDTKVTHVMKKPATQVAQTGAAISS